MNVLFWMSTGFQTTSRHLLISILERLADAGCQITVLKKQTDDDAEALPAELFGSGIRCVSVPVKTANKGNLPVRYIRDLIYVSRCKKQIRPNYDAVFVQSNNVAGFVLKAIRKKLPDAAVTFNVQDIFPYNAAFSGSIQRDGILFKALARTQRYGYQHADRIITISEDMKQTLIEDGADADRIEVIYNWSYQDEPYDDPDLSPVSGMFDRAYFNVVYAGNIGVMQNVDIVVEAAKQIKNDDSVWFHIIGNGVYKEKLEAKAKAYGIQNITFRPMQPPALAPLIYSAADVNVIPLVKDVYRTALPSKTATCLACRKPVIFVIGKGSRFGQKVENQTGCTVTDSDDAKGLAEAILAIKNSGGKADTREFFRRECSRTNNSNRYAQIIMGKSR